MPKVVRAVPIKSKEGLMNLAKGVANRPAKERKEFLALFGDGVEEWYYQEIDGKPYIIAVAEGTDLERGYSMYPELQDPFFEWFRAQVLELSDVDLREVPKAAPSEFVFKLSSSDD